MRLERLQDGRLVLPVPAEVALGAALAEGDDVIVRREADGTVTFRERAELLREIGEIARRATPLPADWRLDRDEASARGPDAG